MSEPKLFWIIVVFIKEVFMLLVLYELVCALVLLMCADYIEACLFVVLGLFLFSVSVYRRVL